VNLGSTSAKQTIKKNEYFKITIFSNLDLLCTLMPTPNLARYQVV